MEKITKNNSNKNFDTTNTLNGKLTKTTKIILIVVFVAMVLTIAVMSVYLKILSSQNTLLKQNINQNFTQNGEILVENNGSAVAAFSMVGNIVSGVEYPQQVKLNCNNLSANTFVRVKASVISSDGENFLAKLKCDSDWVEGDGGHYYYKGMVLPGDSLKVCSRVELPMGFSTQNKSANKHVLVITAETLPNNLNIISTIWTKAPNSWLIAIS